MLPVNRLFIIAAFGIIVLTLYSCSSTGSNMDRQIHIENVSLNDVTIEIWDKESSNSMDVNPTIAIDKEKFQRIDVGESIEFSAGDIKGNYRANKPDRLFLYEIERDSAYYRQSFDIAPGTNELTIQQKGSVYSLQQN